MEGMRSSIIKQTETISKKQRFALFSQPPPVAIGDNSLFTEKSHPRGDDNKPLTQNKNILVSCTRTGKTNRDMFNKLTYKTGDQYLQPAKRELLYQNKDKNKLEQKQSFKPSRNQKVLQFRLIRTNSSYLHVDQKVTRKDPKSLRTDDGKVKCQNRNFTTNPQSKINSDYFKNYHYKQDPYNRQHQFEIKRMKQSKAKMKQPFKNKEHGNKSFASDRKVYGEEGILDKIHRKKLFNTSAIYPHQNQFKPSNRSKGFINQFPKYMQNPEKQLKRKVEIQKKQVWKPRVQSLTRPTPSITLNPLNIKHHV